MFFILAVATLGAPGLAYAAPLKGYEALQVTRSSAQITMTPGETREYRLQFQNLGPNAWVRDGAEFVSIYTYGPKYRNSVFQHASWYRASQPAKLLETRVEPGAAGTIAFTLNAPPTPGTYREIFRLAAEDRAWIPGGEFTIDITVGTQAVPPPTAPPISSAPSVSSPDASGLSALLLLRSERKIVARGGEAVSYKVGVKNTGTKAWGQRSVRLPQIGIAAVEADTYHPSWSSSTLLATNASGEVAPGALDFINFSFNAPRQVGNYTLRYALAADGVDIPDFWIDIPVEVTSNAPHALNAPPRADASVPAASYEMEEPTVRVGILIVDEETDWEVKVTSLESPWKIIDTNGALLAELPANYEVTAFYKNGRYHFNRGKGIEQSSYGLRFVPDAPNAVMKVTNWDRRNRGSDRPYNRYRNVLELRYNAHKDRTWLINELPMEWYLKGLGETSNISHLEYQKALLTAARTYAFYHWSRNTKRVREFFHVTGYADDQVYRGYDQEAASPRIVQSVEETRGQIVTYEGEYAITPYFSRSDGRTRDWSEVWGGSVPWAKSVQAPCDKRNGFALWGHGVGMSAMEALCMANEQAKRWDEILKYFYTGIELDRKWR